MKPDIIKIAVSHQSLAFITCQVHGCTVLTVGGDRLQKFGFKRGQKMGEVGSLLDHSTTYLAYLYSSLDFSYFHIIRIVNKDSRKLPNRTLLLTWGTRTHQKRINQCQGMNERFVLL